MSDLGPERFTIPNCDGTSLPAIFGPAQTSQPRAVAVMSHGCFSDKDEHGRFVRLSSILNGIGLATVRYDFRGHGAHEMPLRRTSVSGMVLDLQAVSRWVDHAFPGTDCYWVASSFGGAVSLLCLQMRYAITPARMALFNPVLDFKTTFLEPWSPAAAEVFSPARWDLAWRTGQLEVGPGITLGPEFLSDLMLLHPELALGDLTVPTRIVHGTADITVSHDLTRDMSEMSPAIDFRSVDGAGHAFTEPAHEAASFDLVADWFSADLPARGKRIGAEA